jgi:predicted nucleic acid-binding protein
VGWVDTPRDSTVGLDTAPLIYFIEENPIWLPVVQPFFEALDRGLFQAVTSTLTITEVLVHPLRRLQGALAEQYRQILLSARNLTTLPVTAAIAEQAADLRSRHNLRVPDAIQLATALNAGANSFVTNDNDLSGPASLRIITLAGLQSLPT